jgi:hypothetical protein
MPSIRIAKELTSGIYYLTLTVRNCYYVFDRYNRFQILADSMNHPAAELRGILNLPSLEGRGLRGG